jgi:hypothetical protein
LAAPLADSPTDFGHQEITDDHRVDLIEEDAFVIDVIEKDVDILLVAIDSLLGVILDHQEVVAIFAFWLIHRVLPDTIVPKLDFA